MNDPWTTQRKDVASRIAAGLAGWYQLQGAQRLSGLEGEDTARTVISQIVNAQGRFLVRVSQRPNNWPDNNPSRMDLSLIGTSANATGWYGAIEVKWPGASFAADNVRDAIIEDVCRLASAETQALNARFMILGGARSSLNKLFDDPHPRAERSEAKRRTLDNFLARRAGAESSIRLPDLLEVYPNAESRVPMEVRPITLNRIKTRVLAHADACIGEEIIGSVYVWQVMKTSPGRHRAARPEETTEPTET